MNFWLKKISIFPVAGIIYLIGQYFRGVWFQTFAINPCNFFSDEQGVFCNSPFSQNIGWPLITAGEMLAIVGIVMLFGNERAWRSWLRFSYWFIPLEALFVMFLAPAQLFPGAPVSRESFVDLFGKLYILITLIIVLRFRFSARNRPAGAAS